MEINEQEELYKQHLTETARHVIETFRNAEYDALTTYLIISRVMFLIASQAPIDLHEAVIKIVDQMKDAIIKEWKGKES